MKRKLFINLVVICNIILLYSYTSVMFIYWFDVADITKNLTTTDYNRNEFPEFLLPLVVEKYKESIRNVSANEIFFDYLINNKDELKNDEIFLSIYEPYKKFNLSWRFRISTFFTKDQLSSDNSEPLFSVTIIPYSRLTDVGNLINCGFTICMIVFFSSGVYFLFRMKRRKWVIWIFIFPIAVYSCLWLYFPIRYRDYHNSENEMLSIIKNNMLAFDKILDNSSYGVTASPSVFNKLTYVDNKTIFPIGNQEKNIGKHNVFVYKPPIFKDSYIQIPVDNFSFILYGNNLEINEMRNSNKLMSFSMVKPNIIVGKYISYIVYMKWNYINGILSIIIVGLSILIFAFRLFIINHLSNRHGQTGNKLGV